MRQVINRLVAGTTWEWSTSAADYLASDGWALSIYLVPRFASPVQAPVVLTAVPDTNGTDHLFQISAAQSAAYAAGQYSFHTLASRAGEVKSVEGTYWTGEVTIAPNPATLTQGHDGRTQSQKGLDDARAAYANAVARAADAGTAQVPVKYAIGERSMEYANPIEAQQGLLVAINYFQRIVNDEYAVSQGRATGPLGRARYGVPGA